MSQPFQIIQATSAHLDQLAPLFDAYRQFYEQAPNLKGAQSYLKARLENDESIVFLALSAEGAGLGFCQLYPTFSSISMRPALILNDLFVALQARKMGLGYALLQRAKSYAQETGAKNLSLATAVDNFSAQRLYKRFGYQRDDEFYYYFLDV